MPETFAQYLEKWLKQSTTQGLNNPLVKMPIKRFRQLQEFEFSQIANGGTFTIGTTSDPIARNLFKNYQTRIRERGEYCAFISSGALEITIAGGGQQIRTALFPIYLKRISLKTTGERIKASVSEDATWQLNPVLSTNLNSLGIKISPKRLDQIDDVQDNINYLKTQLGNRGLVKSDNYIGLFSSQHMVVQQRLTDAFLRRALANNPVIKAKIEGTKVESVTLGEISDDGIEDLGLVLPCDDSQLRVIQLSDNNCSLQVEGPPGTGKSQTIANIISNALYRDRKVLLVCDKKAAITQVEERLTNCGLRPILLNLHDEDLDKREFLKQATEKFRTGQCPKPKNYPFEQLKENRKLLNERVNFGRSETHPSLRIPKRQAIEGMIQLRKDLKYIPNLAINNWHALSKERLDKLLYSIGQWPGLSSVLSNSDNIWNKVRFEDFDNNWNLKNELIALIDNVLCEIESLNEIAEYSASVGIEYPMDADYNIDKILDIVDIVLKKPSCHPQLIGNTNITIKELKHLENIWKERIDLLEQRHPLVLGETNSNQEEAEAKYLVSTEKVQTWAEMFDRLNYYSCQLDNLKDIQKEYLHICEQIGLKKTLLLKTSKAQLQLVLNLLNTRCSIPRFWWQITNNPVLFIEGWISKLKQCFNSVKNSPKPVDLISLERISTTNNWVHIEAMAEHGFNAISYCLHYVNDRKCKYTLRQAYKSIPSRGFKQWRDINLHAVTTVQDLKSFREASKAHSILVQLTENYISVAHELCYDVDQYINNENIIRLKAAATLVEQYRDKVDIFESNGFKWENFWELPDQNTISQIESILHKISKISIPDGQSDNFDEILKFYTESVNKIGDFLHKCLKNDGDRSSPILESFEAQREFIYCQNELKVLPKYIGLQSEKQTNPDWIFLNDVISWRDAFEYLRGQQKLDIDSPKWIILKEGLLKHKEFMMKAYQTLSSSFEELPGSLGGYSGLREYLAEIISEIECYPLWLEKKRWQKKIIAFPEIKPLWEKVLDGSISSNQAEKLFLFNLLRLCEPIAKLSGLELYQTLNTFVKQDENLTTWILENLKYRSQQYMSDASFRSRHSESELQRLSSLQRIRGTVRELVNTHVDYLLEAKRCWMMSPTSLANLIDSNIFEQFGVPFDLVIFDEASQIRVPDGLLSMSFGKQVIIVGDKNQLPPTDFFVSYVNPDLEEDLQDFGISESLLDEFGGVFSDDETHVMLMSHYRSETPDLIRFSNDYFYDSRLEMYPPNHITGIGRRLHYVPNAIYSETAGARNNPTEAREVVKLIELHVNEYPNKSLGVVTMNIPQMELIDELILLAPGKVKEFCADESKFFLRNLETVQGDEMDRIILSLTYGKNSLGIFNAAVLGPLVKSGGERRLNVAITRSRSGMIVVSSLKASDLEASGAQSRGFNCLKKLLYELENIKQGSNFGIDSKRFVRRKDGLSNIIYCDTPFEEQVAEFLENEGYEIECQYGAGCYLIDIVVKEQGRNLLAIECDGASYHSSLVARSRDRARQRMLEKLGWRIHRVWSTNWWYFEDQEKEAIIAAINSARSFQSGKKSH